MQEMKENEETTITVNKRYKDRLFIFIFANPEHKDWMLSLYNAVNHSDYKDPNEITYNTIEDHLFMGMRNDVSFLIGPEMNVFEHQSTYNPNMPLRQLQYVAGLYEQYVAKEHLDKYDDAQLKLPVPRLVCFYNGLKEEPEEMLLELATSFDDNEREKSDIQVQVHMYNVNYHHSPELMRMCKPLEEYAWIVNQIRQNMKNNMTLEKAVNKMIDDIPDDYILADFMWAHRAEVLIMLMKEYTEEEQMKIIKDAAVHKGIKKGREEDKLIVEKLKAGESVKSLIEAGYDSTFVEYMAEALGIQ